MKIQISVFIFLSILLFSCEKPGPEEVLREYIDRISSGECESAKELCTDQLKELVQVHIDQGCVPYECEIHSITCEIQADTAICDCDISIQNFTSTFDLKKINGEWKVDI